MINLFIKYAIIIGILCIIIFILVSFIYAFAITRMILNGKANTLFEKGYLNEEDNDENT